MFSCKPGLSEHNQIYVAICCPRFVIYVNNKAITTDVTSVDGVWHHIYFTWSSAFGDWEIYKDGVLQYSGSDLNPGAVISREMSSQFPEVKFSETTLVLHVHCKLRLV